MEASLFTGPGQEAITVILRGKDFPSKIDAAPWKGCRG